MIAACSISSIILRTTLLTIVVYSCTFVVAIVLNSRLYKPACIDSGLCLISSTQRWINSSTSIYLDLPTVFTYVTPYPIWLKFIESWFWGSIITNWPQRGSYWSNWASVKEISLAAWGYIWSSMTLRNTFEVSERIRVKPCGSKVAN